MNKKKEQQINIELDEKIGTGDYANFTVITHSSAEFIMDFTRLLPGMPKAKVRSRIIMTPSHLKSFFIALNDNALTMKLTTAKSHLAIAEKTASFTTNLRWSKATNFQDTKRFWESFWVKRKVNNFF